MNSEVLYKTCAVLVAVAALTAGTVSIVDQSKYLSLRYEVLSQKLAEYRPDSNGHPVLKVGCLRKHVGEE